MRIQTSMVHILSLIFETSTRLTALTVTVVTVKIIMMIIIIIIIVTAAPTTKIDTTTGGIVENRVVFLVI